MKIYLTEEGYVFCSDAHSIFFESEFEHILKGDLTMLQYSFCKGTEPYQSVEREIVVEDVKRFLSYMNFKKEEFLKMCYRMGLICPNCKGTYCGLNKGSTNFIPIPSINWLCLDCLHEW